MTKTTPWTHCPACGRERGAGCGRDDQMPRVGCYLLGGPPPEAITCEIHPRTTRTRIWFDTEFIEDGRTIDLISIGMVRDDGSILYLENAECDLSRASKWVRDNVLPHLRGGIASIPRVEIVQLIRSFVGPFPEFWAYYADYDWVALCQLFGTMMDLPQGWPMFCLDLKQEAYLRGVELPKQEGVEHDALADARWNRYAWEALQI